MKKCGWYGCKRNVSNRNWGCPEHFSKLPADIKDDISKLSDSDSDIEAIANRASAFNRAFEYSKNNNHKICISDGCDRRQYKGINTGHCVKCHGQMLKGLNTMKQTKQETTPAATDEYKRGWAEHREYLEDLKFSNSLPFKVDLSLMGYIYGFTTLGIIIFLSYLDRIANNQIGSIAAGVSIIVILISILMHRRGLMQHKIKRAKFNEKWSKNDD